MEATISDGRKIIIIVVVGVTTLLTTGGSLLGNYLNEDSPDQSPDKSSGGPYESRVVATDTPDCSKIGTDTLKVNGLAVDAAIAAMFCLGVVSMHSSGIGGGGVMLVYDQISKKATVIDFRETAPATAHKNMFKGNELKAKKGGLSIAVPGEVHGLYEAWKIYGRLPWKRLVQPAIDLAKDGFIVTQAVKEAVRENKEDIKNDPGLRALLLKDNELVKKGDVIKNVEYARTLERVRDDPDSFYSGTLARDILRDIGKVNGIVTQRDLRSYTSIIREPYQSNIQDMTMHLTPPPTSGAVLALILNILRGYDMTSSDRDDKNTKGLTYHRIIESFKFSYARRGQLGDPEFDSRINERAEMMLDPELGDDLRKKIRNKTNKNGAYYDADSFSNADYGTTHVAVMDQYGNAVSVTSTINMKFGAKYRSNKTGIIYNNEMADFDNPDDDPVDDIFPSPFNFPEPGKRPFSSMCPTILTDDDGKVQLVIGASGGKMITTAVSLVLMNKLWFGDNLSEAVDKPRLHSQLVPDQKVLYENKTKYRIDEAVRNDLKKRGHNVIGSNLFAVVQAISREPDGIYAKSDPRKYGAPAGE